jgi:hypothetical protein
MELGLLVEVSSVTEMSIKNRLEVKELPARKAYSLTTSCELIVQENVGASASRLFMAVCR